MYVTQQYIRYLVKECVTSVQTPDATHYFMPPEVLCGKQCIITIKDSDIVRSWWVDRANAQVAY